MRYLFPLSLFIGSSLLFLIQPIIAKALLPHVGGTPAVWTSCMLFFQFVLLGGYAYAALGSAWLRPAAQITIHLVLCALAIVTALPVSLDTPATSFNESQPEIWVMLSLFFSVGLPYFLLSSQATLLQRWYHHAYGASPYFLFSISNVGSMVGLLGYPFILEWLWPLSTQMTIWGAGFIFLTFLLLLLAPKIVKAENKPKTESLGQNLPAAQASRIVLLGFLPSSLFLSTTLYITTDIASFPLFWVLPLALYLLSFILAFSRYSEWWTIQTQKLVLPFVAATFLVSPLNEAGTWALILIILINFLCLLSVSIASHGQAYREKPEARRLTAYYFWLSVGGMLGGAFNTLAPYLFNDVYERYLVLAGVAVLFIPRRIWEILLPKKQVILPFSLITLFLGFIWWDFLAEPGEDKNKTILQKRNFFGVIRVTEDTNQHAIMLSNGTTVHGLQPLAEKDRLSPTSYYHIISEILKGFPEEFFTKPFGVIGLGVGTCYGREGQQTDFFEINPLVIEVAQNTDYFTYLKDCPARSTIIRGDGRLNLVKEPPHKYQMIIVDAFSSDAIPLHLITSEAMAAYIEKLVPVTGFAAFHISNRYFNLSHPIERIAQEHGWNSFLLKYEKNEKTPYDQSATWLFVLPPDSPWADYLIEKEAKAFTANPSTPLWTDSYSNIGSAISW